MDKLMNFNNFLQKLTGFKKRDINNFNFFNKYILDLLKDNLTNFNTDEIVNEREIINLYNKKVKISQDLIKYKKDVIECEEYEILIYFKNNVYFLISYEKII